MSKVKNISIKSGVNKEEWEAFIKSRREANFLHSWNWGEFQQNLGKQVIRLALQNGNSIVGCVQAVKEEARRGNYLAVAGGPITDWNKILYLKKIISELKQKALDGECIFIRLRPQTIDSHKHRQLLKSFGFSLSPMHLTADLTLQLDLDQSESGLLAHMRKNTRYEIRKAKKLKIEVKQSQNSDDIREFYKHQLYLANKHKFVPFSYDFLHEQFRTFVKDDQVKLFHAYQGKTLLASAFIIFYNKEAVYHYGISTKENARLPGSYACQWAAIKKAKSLGMNKYNLWGVAPKDAKDHRFAGVSLFKRGFGGDEVCYLPAHDLPLNWKYSITEKFEKARKYVRRL